MLQQEVQNGTKESLSIDSAEKHAERSLTEYAQDHGVGEERSELYEGTDGGDERRAWMSDLISKSKLLNTIATNVHYDSENPLAQYAKLLALVNDAPAIDAERHGHWEIKRNPMMYQTQPYVHVCSECGTAFPYKMPYCGECGAKMDEVEE